MDVLQVRVTGVLRIAPIDGFFLVESAGTIPLGPAYGRAQVKGLTLEEAEKAIQKKLTEVVKNPEVQVTLPEQTAPSTEQVRWQEVAPPKAPYAISPGDLLSIKVLGTILNQPIDGHYLVEPAGTVPLGPAYGRVAVKGLTLEAAEKAIQKKLAEIIIKPEVQVTLAGWKIDHPMTDHK
jgi:protein involved in polysaccharide export with SLBB domain